MEKEIEKQKIKAPLLVKIVVYWFCINSLYVLIASIATKNYDIYTMTISVLLLIAGSGVITMKRWGVFAYIILFFLLLVGIIMSAVSYGSLTAEIVISIVLAIISIAILTVYYEKFK